MECQLPVSRLAYSSNDSQWMVELVYHALRSELYTRICNGRVAASQRCCTGAAGLSTSAAVVALKEDWTLVVELLPSQVDAVVCSTLLKVESTLVVLMCWATD
ncbi:hypothetical protein B5X24_HaOG215533 [Helicoverpa armigera]|uniref:Uncharacterized protein n=1 Tax=Helicoverpa armigera TaxID=29058 RepID=A0A2W1B8T7_HELAM|nr:hypothetical protein B5X24_HaOG215533 [Helicoverpa armigera]